jgi:hypothetical protein
MSDSPGTERLVVILMVGLAIFSFSAGRWLAPEKVRTEIKVVEVIKQDQKEHTKTIIHEVDRPDGTKEITTEIVVDTHTTTDTTVHSDQTTETTRGTSKVTVAALGGIRLSDPTPLYGVSVSKPILGPITIGVWGLSNGTLGASVGLTF